MPECTEDLFLEQVKSHEMEILLDNCQIKPYRHVRFSRPNNSTCMFELITFPMHLVYSGDMGTFVFSRINDMFDFFPIDNNDFNNDGTNHISINPSYWSEKLQAADIRTGGYMEFSAFKFHKFIMDWYAEIDIEDNSIKELLLSELEGSVLEYSEEYDLVRAARDFIFKYDDEELTLESVFENEPKTYTYHYLWACYAIQWGIAKYKEKKAELCKT